MREIDRVERLADLSGPTHLAVGVFDGVHLGHQSVIEKTVAGARADQGSAVVLTFEPHPLTVLRPAQAPRLLTSHRHKALLIDRLGVDALLTQTFTKEFSRTSPDGFVLELVNHAQKLRQICVGDGWNFGADRAGNVSLLEKFAEKYGFELTTATPVAVDGIVVSSTRIREAMSQGNLIQCERMLGRPFSVLGVVVAGDQRGRQLGFPTANVDSDNEQYPPDGVYAVQVRLLEKIFSGVANIGYRPTVDSIGNKKHLEVHLFDFDRSIYGEELEVYFIRLLRSEKKFANLDQLKQQIELDVRAAREVLSESH